MGESFERMYDINYNDVDWTLKATTTSMVNFICDIGMRQTEALKELKDINKRNAKDSYGWVFYKYDLKFKKYPKYSDIVKVKTECVGLKKFYAFRSYLLKDKNEEIIGEGVASFLIIDLNKRKLIRIPKEEYELFGFTKDYDNVIEIEDIVRIDDGEYCKEFEIGYGEIDSNFHVNNVNYLKWSLEALPKDIVLEKEIERVTINFLKESKYGETIKSIAKLDKSESQSFHKITKMNGEILALVHFYFKDREK